MWAQCLHAKPQLVNVSQRQLFSKADQTAVFDAGHELAEQHQLGHSGPVQAAGYQFVCLAQRAIHGTQLGSIHNCQVVHGPANVQSSADQMVDAF